MLRFVLLFLYLWQTGCWISLLLIEFTKTDKNLAKEKEKTQLGAKLDMIREENTCFLSFLYEVVRRLY